MPRSSQTGDSPWHVRQPRLHPRRDTRPYRSAADIVILRDGDTLEAGDVVAGWLVAVAALFG